MKARTTKYKNTAAYERGVTDGGREARGEHHRIMPRNGVCKDYLDGHRRGVEIEAKKKLAAALGVSDHG